MLNEMMVLRRTLRELGVSTKSRHPDIQMLAKSSPVLRVFLQTDGKVASVEVISQDLAPKYWTFRDTNKNSFPRISFKPALRSGPSDDELKNLSNKRMAVEQRRYAYLSLRDKYPITIANALPWILSGHRDRIQQRGDTVRQAENPRARLFAKLVDVFLTTNDLNLLCQTEELAAQQLGNNPSEELLDLTCRLSFFDGTKSKKPADACDLYFDFENEEDYFRAGDPDMVQILSDAMPSASEKPFNGICALSGEEALVEDNKFPQANLGPLGLTSLHTRNPKIFSAHRYGKSGPASMQVGQALASELQADSEEMTKAVRKGKTWESIPSEKPGQSDLLLCYIPNLPDLELAQAMVVSEAAFEKLGERMAELAKGNSVFVPEDARIEICVLRKIDDANKKTIHSCSLTRKAFEQAAGLWTLACQNVPDIELIVPGKKGEKALRIHPRTLTFGRIVSLSKNVYRVGGQKAQEATGLSFAEAFGLVMKGRSNDQANVRRILRFMLGRFAPLLIGIGHVRSRQLKSSSKPDMEAFKPESRRNALDAVSLIGALLYQLDIKITKDMNTPAYLLGQLLAGSDILHRGYCLDVRGGSLPPKLIGNSALTTAERNPQSALNQLSRRWPPYNGWATKRRRDDFKQMIEDAKTEGDKGRFRMIRDGAWAPVNMKPLAAALAESLTAERPDDAFRAQLFLGYVAGLPRPE